MEPVVTRNTIDHFVERKRAKGVPPNKLINEKSPYLLQHAFNPVQWHPWGEEAFALARKKGKPIFLSIGYSTCHWCHVMEKESFENPEIAALLNRYFVAIKVDREERPDLDQIYMAVTQAMTGGGGWPMSVFLTPDLLPFFAGTYFPPQSKYGRPGFPELLQSIHNAWEKDPETIATKAASIIQHLSVRSIAGGGDLDSLAQVPVEAASQFGQMYDAEYGGFGQAPKFPRPVALNFLLRRGQRMRDQALVDISLQSLKKMARGGMYDHLGGGFHRYSVDRYWRVPHFEKMLYDQALLAVASLEAYQFSGGRDFADSARETLDFVLDEMASPDGGFYSALDADSARAVDPTHKQEGAFYLWSEAEIDAALSPALAGVFKYRYGVEAEGNTIEDPHGDFGNGNVLYAAHSIVETAEKFTLPVEEVTKRIEAARKILLVIRAQRPRPHLDDKVLASWNGLMISALAKGAVILDSPRYLAAAKRTAEFIRTMMLDDTQARLVHRYRDGVAGIDGQLDDYAFVCQGFLDLYEATFEPHWLDLARRLTETQVARFADSRGGFFESAGDDASVIMRMKADYDGAEPSGNSISAVNLLRLGRMLGGNFAERGKKTVAAFATQIKAFPTAMPQMLVAFDFMVEQPMQIVIVGSADGADTHVLRKTIAKHFLPNGILLGADADGGLASPLREAFGYLQDMSVIDGKATAYVCKNLSCQAPTNDPGKLDEMLSAL